MAALKNISNVEKTIGWFTNGVYHDNKVLPGAIVEDVPEPLAWQEVLLYSLSWEIVDEDKKKPINNFPISDPVTPINPYGFGRLNPYGPGQLQPVPYLQYVQPIPDYETKPTYTEPPDYTPGRLEPVYFGNAKRKIE